MPSVPIRLILLVTLCFTKWMKANGEQVSCLDARSVCHDDDFCRLSLISINSNCGNTDGPSCVAPDLVRCRIVLENPRIQDIFVDCYCDPTTSQFASCQNIQRLTVANPCKRNESVATESPIAATPTPRPDSCFKVIKACKEDAACQPALQAFYDACPTRKHNTCRLTTEEERRACTATHRALDARLVNCTCEEDKTKCKRQQKRIQQNPCVLSTPSRVDGSSETPQRLTGDDSSKDRGDVQEREDGGQRDLMEEETDEDEECEIDESSVVIGPMGGYNNGSSTCKEALVQCTADTLCRIDFSDYIYKCNPQEVEDYCDRDACRTIVRKLFTDTSPIYTHALVFCHCEAGDIPCHVIKRGLNPICSRSGVQNQDCLDLVQSCYEDSYCKSAYKTYQELCKPSNQTGTGCAYSYGACRSARVGIIGTIMGSSCSCDSEDKLCRYHQKMVSDNLCYNRSEKGYYSSVAPAEQREVLVPATDCVVQGRSDDNIRKIRYRVKVGALALVPFGDTCYSMCMCVQNGNMENCVTQICPELTDCTVDNIRRKHDELFSHTSYGNCICFSGKILCARDHSSSESGKESQLVSPSMSIAYDSLYKYRMTPRLEKSFDRVTVIGGLQSIIDSQELTPCQPTCCQLQLLEQSDNTLLISVFYTKNMNACYNQLERLTSMINTKHPMIHLNPTLSILKIATVEEGAHQRNQNQANGGMPTSKTQTLWTIPMCILVMICGVIL